MSFKLPSRILRAPSFALLVLVFTLLVTALLWWQVNQSHQQMRQQVLLQTKQRSLQLAGAMAGQVEAQLHLADVVIKEIIDHWGSESSDAFDRRVQEELQNLPQDMMSHVFIVNAAGRLVYNSLGIEKTFNVSDPMHFLTAKNGDDQLTVSTPARSRSTGEWVFSIGKPVVRNGRFEGAVYLLVDSAKFSKRLNSLTLSEDDVVTLIHANGAYMARSTNSERAMGMGAPADSPFLLDLAIDAGNFRTSDSDKRPTRTYGWKRMDSTGLVVSVGIADNSVLAPLANGHKKAIQATAFWSVLLMVFGGIVSRGHLKAVRQQRALTKSEELLKEAQQVARLGSWELNHQSGERRWSDEFFRIMGLEPGAVAPSMEVFRDIVHPDDRASLQKSIESSLQRRCEYNLVYRLLLPDGSCRYVRERGRTSYKGLEPLRSVGTLLDITELREAQSALEELNANLENRIAERTEELTKANRDLQAFTYSVSHDLRTPLRSIHGFACVLEEDEGPKLSSVGKRNLKRIQDGTRRMGKLITDLLSLARLGAAHIEVRQVHMTGLAKRIANKLQEGEPNRKVQWQIETGLSAFGDHDQIEAVLQLLLENAWKFSSKAESPTISLRLVEESGGMRTFCVQDNGAGFDMAYYEQLFQPFKRIHPTDAFEGSGVGLAIVSRIVHRHGGTVRGEGHVGRGAAFCFSLPAQPW